MNAFTYGTGGAQDMLDKNSGARDPASNENPTGGADRSAKFWDRIAERYAKKPVPDEAVYERKLATTRDYLRPDMEVLEFGCGTGSTAIAHAPYVKHIWAIDISSKMIEIAKEKAATGSVRNVTFEQSTIQDLHLSGESLDAVLGFSILHLLEDEQAAIAKVHAMLKPGGVFVSSTACLADTASWLRYVLPIGQALGRVPFVKFFSKQDLLNSLESAGFELDHVWQPGKGKAVFVVAKKPDEGDANP